MKKTIKILSVIMIALLIVTAITPVFATDVGGVSVSVNKDGVSNKVSNIGGKVLGAIQVVGTLISVGTLMVLGIKYMMGSAEEKAEYKKTMIPYAIGAILLFAAVTIASYIASVAGTLTEEGGTTSSSAIVVRDDTRII